MAFQALKHCFYFMDEAYTENEMYNLSLIEPPSLFGGRQFCETIQLSTSSP